MSMEKVVYSTQTEIFRKLPVKYKNKFLFRYSEKFVLLLAYFHFLLYLLSFQIENLRTAI